MIFENSHQHRATGYKRGVPYVRLSGYTKDATGIKHCELTARCDICGEEFLLCNIHDTQFSQTREIPEWKKLQTMLDTEEFTDLVQNLVDDSTEDNALFLARYVIEQYNKK